jgi:hypothetical protein
LGLSGKAGREKASVVADRDKARGKVATKLKRLYESGVNNRQREPQKAIGVSERSILNRMSG